MISDIIKGSGGSLPSAGENWVFEDDLTLKTTYFGEIAVNTGCYGNGLYVVAGASGKCATSPDGITWTGSASFLTVFGTNAVYNIIYANNIFMAVGANGKIATSPDGITWTLKGTVSGINLYSVAYGNGVFITVGDNAGIARSTDGVTWTRNDKISIFGMSTIKSITFGNGLFIAVGILGRCASSTDGITWEPVDISKKKYNVYTKLTKIKYINGKYFTLGFNGLMMSDDGITWKGLPSLSTIFNNGYINDIIFDGYSFMAVGYNLVASSTDGILWTQRGTIGVSCNLTSIANIGGTYLAVDATGKAFYSPDNANTWFTINAITTNTFKKIIFDGTKFIAVGNNNIMATSVTGSNWDTHTTTLLPGGQIWNINDIIYNNGLYIVACNNGTIGISSDLNKWTLKTIGNGTQNNTSINYFNGYYYVTGSYGDIFKSNDTINWTQISVSIQIERSTNNILTSMCYSGSKFIAATDSGLAVESVDGDNWTQMTSLTDEIFGSTDTTVLKYLNNKFVALSSNKIAYSDDGLNWSKSYNFNVIANAFATYGIAYGNGVYVVVGQANNCLTSIDGVTWTTRFGLHDAMVTGYIFKDIEFKNGLFVAVATNGKIATSPDGITWTARVSNTTSDLSKIIYANGKFVATGTNSSVYSTDGITWSISNYSTEWGNNVVYCLTYIDGIIYNTGNSGKIITSVDGITWVSNTSHTVLNNGAAIKIFFKTNNLYHIVNASNVCLISSDNISWSVKPSSEFTTTALFTSVTTNDITILAGSTSYAIFCLNNSNIWSDCYGLQYVESYNSYSNIIKYINGNFVIGGNNSGFVTSTDGINWIYDIKIRNKFGYANSIKDITFLNNKYVVVGAVGKCVFSLSGGNWEVVPNFYTAIGSINNNINVIINDGVNLAAFGELGKYIISSNFDLTNWEYKDSLSKSNSVFNGIGITTICDNGSLIIVSGGSGKCVTSTDGVTWNLNKQVKDLALVNGVNISASLCAKDLYPSKFLLFLVGGYIISSLDGINWIKENSNLPSIIGSYKVTKAIYVDGLYYIVGTAGKCAISQDGINWSSITSLNTIFGTATINDIVYANGLFIVVGVAGKVATSIDGVTWTLNSNVAIVFGTKPIFSVAYGNGLYVAVGQASAIIYSTDGISWVKVNSIISLYSTTFTAFSIIFDGIKFIAVGAVGKYAYSYDGIIWNLNNSYTLISSNKNYWAIYKAVINNKSIYLSGGDAGYLLESFGQ